MKPNNPGSRRQKVILYYTLAVVLPGMILGYMAYRGIRNDQALREKESRGRLETDSQAFFAAIEASFEKFIADHASGPTVSVSNSPDPAILARFNRDSAGSLKITTHKMLYLPAELLVAQPVPFSTPTGLVEGSKLEFIEGKYSDALRFYQRLAVKTASPAEKNLAMVAAARLFKKLNQPDSAKALYDQIRKNHPGGLLNGQIPMGLMANLEILKINKGLGEKEEMTENTRQFLELLLHPPCEYGENQFGLFYQSFKDMIPKTSQVIDSLLKEIDTQRARTDLLIGVLSDQRPKLPEGNTHFRGEPKDLVSIPLNSEKLTAMYLTWTDNGGHQTGMVIDFGVYLKSQAEKLFQAIDPNSSINVKIEDKRGKPVFSKINKEGAGYLSFSFPENLPQWKLLVMENRPGFLASLMKAGSGIYLFVFILIALLMVLGLFFTVYTLNSELRLNKLKSEFISNVSHELKSPLTSIRMMTEMLHQNRVSSEHRKSEYYSVMLEESEHLGHLIDNVLDFSRMEDDRKKYNFDDLDLNELLIKFLETTCARLPLPGFDIRYNQPEGIPVIQADKNAILQVFHNLVDNAIKFSGTSRQIDISLFTQEDELLFCVKDYGIGISAKDQEKIFERFYRCEEAQSLSIKGSGIGLTIVKKIIEAHKGHLTVESRPGEGSTFCVHLPISNKTNA